MTTVLMSSPRPAVSVVIVRSALIVAIVSPLLSGALWGVRLQMVIDALPPEQTTDMAVAIIVPIFWAPIFVVLNLGATVVALRRPADVRRMTGSTIALACVAVCAVALLWGGAYELPAAAQPDWRIWVTRLLGVGSLVAPIGALWLIVVRMWRSPSL